MGNRRHRKGARAGKAPPPTHRKGHFQCFACHDRDINLVGYEMFIHQSLDIAICDSCNNLHHPEEGWHSGEDWNARDDNEKQMFCEICAEGGVLLPCDDCEHSYCTECLKRWLGTEKCKELIDDEDLDFKCFTCLKDDEKLSEAHPKYAAFKEATANYQKEQVRVREESQKVDMLEDLKSSKRKKKFQCFSCDKFHDFSKNDGIKCHPDFKTACCLDCYDTLTGDDWSFDEDGKSEYCVVSGHCVPEDAEEDGNDDLYLCDTKECKNAFCARILKFWLSAKEFKDLEENEDAEFICFGCDASKGNYTEFLKMTKQFFTAFEADADFIPKIDSKRAEKRKALKKAKQEEASRAKKGRRTGRKRVSTQRDVEESEEEELEAPETRGVKTSFAEVTTDEESDPEIDYAKRDGPLPPPTEKEALTYLKSRLENAVAARYKDTKAYKNLLKSIK